jgi:hypothetical protein
MFLLIKSGVELLTSMGFWAPFKVEVVEAGAWERETQRKDSESRSIFGYFKDDMARLCWPDQRSPTAIFSRCEFQVNNPSSSSMEFLKQLEEQKQCASRSLRILI